MVPVSSSVPMAWNNSCAVVAKNGCLVFEEWRESRTGREVGIRDSALLMTVFIEPSLYKCDAWHRPSYTGRAKDFEYRSRCEPSKQAFIRDGGPLTLMEVLSAALIKTLRSSGVPDSELYCVSSSWMADFVSPVTT